MDFEEAQVIWDRIKANDQDDLKNDFMEAAVRYAHLRVEWLLAESEKRLTLEEDRTLAHNAFLTWVDILARNATKAGKDTSWREMLGNDRKRIGDFACMLHCILGVSAR